MGEILWVEVGVYRAITLTTLTQSQFGKWQEYGFVAEGNTWGAFHKRNALKQRKNRRNSHWNRRTGQKW